MDKYILFVFKLVSISICEYMKAIFEAILNAIDIYIRIGWSFLYFEYLSFASENLYNLV